MILHFEGFHKATGYGNQEAQSQLVTSRPLNTSATQVDGYFIMSNNVRGSSSIQLPVVPVQPKLVVGIKYKVSSITATDFGEIGAAVTDYYVRTGGVVAQFVTLPSLPVIVINAGRECRILAPGALVQTPLAADVLAAWSETANFFSISTDVEIEYDFTGDKIRARINGELRSEIDYVFSEEQRTTPMRATYCGHGGGSSMTARNEGMYCATESVGKFTVARLKVEADGPSYGYASGDKFSKVVNKASGLPSDVSSSIEFGLQDLPAGQIPLAVIVNAAVSATHTSARATNADVSLTLNGASTVSDVEPIPRMQNSHTHLQLALPTQPGGQPWTEAAVNSLTAGIKLEVTEPVGGQIIS